MSKQLIGRVLWFRERDGFGIITDPSGSDYYFHRSEIHHRSANIQKGSYVTFYLHEEIADSPCATRVMVLDKAAKTKIAKTFVEFSL